MSEKTIKRIGVLTGGGDCAGLNAILRAVVHRARRTHGWQVLGLYQGTLGLLERPPLHVDLGLEDFRGQAMRVGGTMLGTASHANPYEFPGPDGATSDRSREVLEGFRLLGLDALIGIGGDGTLELLHRLMKAGGLPFVGIPKTIDNDVAETEFAVGFSTAAALATEALDRLLTTAVSHGRTMVLEVMGRDAGHIALEAGIAGGADVILIPEIPWSPAGLMAKLGELDGEGQSHALVIVAEGVKTELGAASQIIHADGTASLGGIGQHIANLIARQTGAHTRATVLGHIQRGGVPGMRDRVLAQAFGLHAVDLIAAGKFGRMVAWRERRVIDVDLKAVAGRSRPVDPDEPRVHMARNLGAYIGERGGH